MKNFLASMMAFMLILSTSACSETDTLQEQNKSKNSSMSDTKQAVDFGKTVPVSLENENGIFKVSFIVSAQFYTIKDSKENEKFIDLIKHAIQNELPIHVYLMPNSKEILKVENVTDAETRYFKSILTKQLKTQEKKALSNILPNITTLNNIFIQIKNQSCKTLTASAPCLTFQYPVDGCYARAHKMRQIFAYNGYDCEKQFVYGNLKASTGTCCVEWNYHVAILVSYKNWVGTIEKRIIDPSLFPNEPVQETVWRNACLNSYCGTTFISAFVNTPGYVYYRSPNDSYIYDNNYTKTNCVLSTFGTLSGCSPVPAPSVAACGF